MKWSCLANQINFCLGSKNLLLKRPILFSVESWENGLKRVKTGLAHIPDKGGG
jgi:hypothetical protein